MLRFKKQKPGRLYTLISLAVSLGMAVGLFVFPSYAQAFLILLLVLLPFAGYVLDVSLNTVVAKLKTVEAKIQGSFQRFEDREKQYKFTVEELQKELAKLQQLNIHLQEAQNVQDIVYHLAEVTQTILEFDRTLIFLYNKHTNMLECRETRGYAEGVAANLQIPATSEGGVLAKAFQEKRLYHLQDGETVPPEFQLASAYDAIQLLQAKASVILPLILNEQGLGLLTVDNLTTQKPITPQEIELLKLFTHQASLFLMNIRMQEELRQLNAELEQNYRNLLQRKEFYIKIANDLSAAMTEMSFSINQVTKSAHLLTEQSEHLSIQGNELRNHLSKIDDIIASINNVTRQTKLLAFNATMEAVRVGEFGKGFAVVAEEVRKLAEQSADDSKMIKTMLISMQEAIKAIAEVADATHNIALLQQGGTDQMSLVTKDVMKRAEDLVDSLQF